MLKELVIFGFFILCCQALPRYLRLKRSAEDGLKYGPCKNTYDQCPEWKGQGMCTSDQYKDYMMTVCPVTCEFCRDSKKKITRDNIPLEAVAAFKNTEVEGADEMETASGAAASGEASGSEESGSGSEKLEEGKELKESSSARIPVRKFVKNKTVETVKKNKTEATASLKTHIAQNSTTADDNADEQSESGEASGQSESEPEDEEEALDEEGSARDEESLPIQTGSEKLRKTSKKKGTISLVLRQNYQGLYNNMESPSYQMLSGNVKKDLEKVLKGVEVSDIQFNEANIEGNPRQMGKTKVTFHLNSHDQKLMKSLTKLVDSGSINGLSVIGGSLEYDE